MKHAKDIELIELVANRLSAEREETLLRHLEACPACRGKLEGIRKTWDLLGAWDVSGAEHFDVLGALAASGEGEAAGRSVIRFPAAGMAFRIAAAVVFTVLAGYTGGRWSVRRTQAISEIGPPPYVSALGLETGESLSLLVLQDEPAAREEG